MKLFKTTMKCQLQNHALDFLIKLVEATFGAFGALKPSVTPMVGSGLLPLGVEVEGACDGAVFL